MDRDPRARRAMRGMRGMRRPAMAIHRCYVNVHRYARRPR
eukprot:SAG31_NODE_17904_length_654_cov_0.848649_1_plen_39_part_10